jgi:hypothetical protein
MVDGGRIWRYGDASGALDAPGSSASRRLPRTARMIITTLLTSCTRSLTPCPFLCAFFRLYCLLAWRSARDTPAEHTPPKFGYMPRGPSHAARTVNPM